MGLCASQFDNQKAEILKTEIYVRIVFAKNLTSYM